MRKMGKKIAIFIVSLLDILALHSQGWVYRPEYDIRFPLPDSLVGPYLCDVDNKGNLWVISSSAIDTRVKNALFKASFGDSVFKLMVDFDSDLNVESTRGITCIGDTVYVVSRKPGTPMPSTSIMYEYLDGDVEQCNQYSGSGYGTWVLGLSATRDKFVYSGLSFHTSIRVFNFTDTTSSRGLWVPILPLDLHPIEPGGHDGTGISIIRDIATIPGADYTDPETPFYTSRNSDSTGTIGGGIAVWKGGTENSPKDYSGQRVTDLASDLAFLSWTPYGIAADRSGNLYVCGTDTNRRWVKVFSIVGTFAMEIEEFPCKYSKSTPVSDGAPILAPADIALNDAENIAYVIDYEAKKAFIFTKGDVGIDLNDTNFDHTFKLFPNYPNPFNVRTIISYRISEKSRVELSVYDILGNLIVTLVNEEQEGGTYEFELSGEKLSSGIYFCRLKVGNHVEVNKMILLK